MRPNLGRRDLHKFRDQCYLTGELCYIARDLNVVGKNAAGRQLLRELWEAINMVKLERTTRCVVVRSAVSNVFCAGADLKVAFQCIQPSPLTGRDKLSLSVSVWTLT